MLNIVKWQTTYKPLTVDNQLYVENGGEEKRVWPTNMDILQSVVHHGFWQHVTWHQLKDVSQLLPREMPTKEPWSLHTVSTNFLLSWSDLLWDMNAVCREFNSFTERIGQCNYTPIVDWCAFLTTHGGYCGIIRHCSFLPSACFQVK